MAYQTPKLRPERFLGLTWDQITSQLQGIERQQAMALWQWAAYRFSSYGTAQAHHFKRYGTASTIERVNRFRDWLGLVPH